MDLLKKITVTLCFFTFGIMQAGTVNAADRLLQIQQRGHLNVCMWPGYFSISYQNPRTGKLEGIDIDMAHSFARQLGVSVNFVQSSFSKLQQNMTNDACDIAMHGVGVTVARQVYMDFSEPHLRSGIYAIADKSNPLITNWQSIDQVGVVVVVQKGTYMEPAMKQYLKRATLSVVDSFKAREQAVQSVRADVFMTDFPYVKRMITLTDWSQLFAPPAPFYTTDYAYTVPKGEKQWLDVVNTFLRKSKKSGELALFAKKHGLQTILGASPPLSKSSD